jgi:hypothetical protein
MNIRRPTRTLLGRAASSDCLRQAQLQLCDPTGARSAVGIPALDVGQIHRYTRVTGCDKHAGMGRLCCYVSSTYCRCIQESEGQLGQRL